MWVEREMLEMFDNVRLVWDDNDCSLQCRQQTQSGQFYVLFSSKQDRWWQTMADDGGDDIHHPSLHYTLTPQPRKDVGVEAEPILWVQSNSNFPLLNDNSGNVDCSVLSVECVPAQSWCWTEGSLKPEDGEKSAVTSRSPDTETDRQEPPGQSGALDWPLNPVAWLC